MELPASLGFQLPAIIQRLQCTLREYRYQHDQGIPLSDEVLTILHSIEVRFCLLLVDRSADVYLHPEGQR